MTSININSQKFGPLVLALWMGMSVLRIRKRKKGKERTILRFPFSFPKKLKPFLPNTPTSSNTLSSLHFSNSGFLNFGAINILGQIILCVCVGGGEGGRGLSYLRTAGCKAASLASTHWCQQHAQSGSDNQKCFPDTAKSSPRNGEIEDSKISLVQNHC